MQHQERQSIRSCVNCGASLTENICAFCGSNNEIRKAYTKEDILNMFPSLKTQETVGFIKIDVIEGDIVKITNQEGSYTQVSVERLQELNNTETGWSATLLIALNKSNTGLVDFDTIMKSTKDKMQSMIPDEMEKHRYMAKRLSRESRAKKLFKKIMGQNK